MLRRISVFSVFMLTACAPLIGYAQESKPAPPPRPSSVYRIEYVFSEIQNEKRVNARSYTVVLRSRERGSIRLGNRIPIAMSSKDSKDTQLTYLDVGVNIDCRVEDTDLPDNASGVDLFTNLDISSLPPDQQDNRSGAPIVRQIKFQNENVVPLGRITLLSNADEVEGTRKLQIEVTATRLR